MTRGSCLCSTVRWSFDGALDRMTHCHCEMCRKAHGAPFATYAIGSGEHFRFDQGEDAISHYESSPGFVRAFCSHCGSVVPYPVRGTEIGIPAGPLDDDPGMCATHHIYAKWKAPWHPITDPLPRHDALESGGEPRVDRQGPSPVHRWSAARQLSVRKRRLRGHRPVQGGPQLPLLALPQGARGGAYHQRLHRNGGRALHLRRRTRSGPTGFRTPATSARCSARPVAPGCRVSTPSAASQ